jgi:AraC-like DNA-binding protein
MENLQFRYNRGLVIQCAPDWAWDSGDEPFYDMDIWLVLGGTGTLKCPGQTYQLSAGNCFILKPGDRYIGHTVKKNPVRVGAIHFDILDSSSNVITNKFANEIALHRKVESTDFLEALISRAVAANAANNSARADRLTQVLLEEVFEIDHVSRDIRAQQHIPEEFSQLVNKIKVDSGRGWTVEIMAGKVFYCPDHFTRIFKDIYGLTPQLFLQNVRIEDAKKMLGASAMPVSAIAQELGYSDHQHFINQFKKHTGLTPLRYRKSVL